MEGEIVYLRPQMLYLRSASTGNADCDSRNNVLSGAWRGLGLMLVIDRSVSDIRLTVTVTVERLSIQVQIEAIALLSRARILLKADARGFEEVFVLEEDVDVDTLEEVDVDALEDVDVDALEEVDVDALEEVDVKALVELDVDFSERLCRTVVSTMEVKVRTLVTVSSSVVVEVYRHESELATACETLSL